MTEAIVVDTNVLEHLFNPDWNGDGHIDRLLEKITATGKQICMDAPEVGGKSRILKEDEHRLQPFWKRAMERGNCLQWLRYVVYMGTRQTVGVNLTDGLGSCIESKIGHSTKVKAEDSDQVFVYVASALDSVLISNNKNHITNHAPQLRKCAKKQGSNNTDFISSTAAAAAI